MDNRPIGIFDSGLGGLTAVRQLLRLLPGEDIVYFGDTGRVPYGNRSRETIARYARQDCRFLLENDVKLLIAACGTVSSAAADVLEGMPVPAFGVVEPAAKAAVEATRSGRIGVIGTSATVRSGAFQRCITDLRRDVQVIMQACPMFVPLVENGWIDRADPIARLMAERYLQPLREQRIDTLILGCTHFPLLTPILSDVLGEKVTLIDSGREAALRCAQLLSERDALNTAQRQGCCRFYISDRQEDFARMAAMFLGHPVEGDLHMVNIDALDAGN